MPSSPRVTAAFAVAALVFGLQFSVIWVASAVFSCCQGVTFCRSFISTLTMRQPYNFMLGHTTRAQSASQAKDIVNNRDAPSNASPP
jgi:hypothetical protein